MYAPRRAHINLVRYVSSKKTISLIKHLYVVCGTQIKKSGRAFDKKKIIIKQHLLLLCNLFSDSLTTFQNSRYFKTFMFSKRKFWRVLLKMVWSISFSWSSSFCKLCLKLLNKMLKFWYHFFRGFPICVHMNFTHRVRCQRHCPLIQDYAQTKVIFSIGFHGFVMDFLIFLAPILLRWYQERFN